MNHAAGSRALHWASANVPRLLQSTVIGTFLAPGLAGLFVGVWFLIDHHAGFGDWMYLPVLAAIFSVTLFTGPLLASDEDLADPTRFYLLAVVFVLATVGVELTRWAMRARKTSGISVTGYQLPK